jgi:hypothetical protein
LLGQHQRELAEVDRYGFGERVVSELLRVAQQPSQKFQSQLRPKAKSGTLTSRRLYARGFDHPHQPLPASGHRRSVSLIFATFPMLAFLLLEPHPVPLRCPPHGEHRNKSHDDGGG